MEELIKEQLPSLAGATPEELAHAIFDVLDAKKAQNIKILRVQDQTVITDYFVICTGNSSTQVKSLAGEVEYKLGLREVDPLHFEGRDNNGWIVLDYSSVIVHIFSRENRDFYQLEKLYGDAEAVTFVGIDDKIGEEQ
ncbi:MAG: ribosome silencing factor [Clostridia bacterium]|nr:ribosome silencing factor [Clostridia bacterium]